ncbi:MAG: alpha/beta hydrolase [Acidimicrobiia bacterium]|nr:alpha/beta hydrolase [Acidimicrobiia bacterium]
MAAFSTDAVTTAKGIDAKVRRGGAGQPLVWFHGAGGLAPTEPLLDLLAERYHVHAAEWPGYGEERTEQAIEDMLDFALHGWDLVEAMGLGAATPHLVGHSMGGMIAAEMAALNPRGVARLVLVNSAGLWLDSHPIPDIFAMLPFELAEALFVDAKAGEAAMTGGLDFSDNTALTAFMVNNARRLGTAGKILFPVPNRRLSKRLYRITNPTLLLWGAEDRLIEPKYAEAFAQGLVNADSQVTLVEGAAHMTPYEQPAAAAEAITGFLG